MIAQIEPAVEFKVWQAIQGGLDMVILRAKEAKLEVIKSTLSIMRTALGNGFPIVVNAGDRFSKLVDANGYHFPESTLGKPDVIHKLGTSAWKFEKGPKPDPNGKILGVSVHSVEAAQKAAKLVPDYLLAGTVFATASHKGEKPGGLEHLKAICQATPIPVIAIGGITPQNAGECIRAGAVGVAALSPFKGAGREALAKAYKEAMAV